MKFPSFLIALSLISFASFASAQSGDPLPIAGGFPLETGTVPQNGTSEVQQFVLTGSGAATVSFSLLGSARTLTLTGTETTTLVSSKLTAALVSIPTIGVAGATVSTSGTGTLALHNVLTSSVTFAGNLVNLAVPQMVATVTSGSMVVTGTTTTPGVTADGRKAATGRLLLSLSGTGGHPALYINSSATALQPSWTLIGPAGQ